ncbi:hypothetical protein FRB90_012718 [Tulasnella sp. 427]|nr:hypothetical protein FRB90_012718 [Tulasnella sp. 427]
MKFARYLEDTQIPEWKKKYIDYKGLKKHITAVRKDREAHKTSERKPSESIRITDSPEAAFKLTTPRSRRRASTVQETPSILNKTPNENSQLTTSPQQQYGSSGSTPPLQARAKRSPSVRMQLPPQHEPLETFKLPPPARSLSEHEDAAQRVFPSTGASVVSATSSRPKIFSKLSFRRSMTKLRGDPTRPQYETYDDLLSNVPPLERKFFDYLDGQVDKAEMFFDERYREAAVRLSALKEQFTELAQHRRAYHNSRLIQSSKWKALPLPKFSSQVIQSAVTGLTRHLVAAKDEIEQTVTQSAEASSSFHRDPETYQSAKKDLKHAVLEYHRFLELLSNFQACFSALNVTAIRKSLKKFEKATGHNIHQLYNRERVDILSISSDKGIKSMIDEIEKMYASRFEGGDLKKARNRLRMWSKQKTHHFSTFRSGIQIGLAIPALIIGSYQASRPDVQQIIPYWRALLEVYSALAIPVVFSVLIGLNMIAWGRKRLNYVFIFELDLRTVIDPREYFEIPSFLFMTLSYAYMLSFSRIFEPHIASTVWPVAWLVLFGVVMFDPLPFMHNHSRFWLLRNWSKLVLPGLYPVEFADFWMGDQMCSMIYTLSRLYFMGCVYSVGWENATAKCNMSTNWIAGVVLTSIPSLIRLIQCIKRYADSKNHIHLINGGKYSSSIVAYALFFNWRNQGSHQDRHYIAWIFFNIVASIYTSGWDLLMDWSLLQSHATHRFLRSEILYGDYFPVYYFAIISNVLIRFVWIIYAPPGRFDFRIRAVIAATLEMLRRFQWNFFRVENEHVGNADQYRVTREMPLPYSFDSPEARDDSDDDENDHKPRRSRESSDHGEANQKPPSRESFVEPFPERRSVRLTSIRSEDEGQAA